MALQESGMAQRHSKRAFWKLYFILSQAVNSMHIKCEDYSEEKYCMFSLVTGTIYIFSVAKQDNFGIGIFYQRF